MRAAKTAVRDQVLAGRRRLDLADLGEQMGRDRPRGLAELEQRTPRPGGDELVTER